MSLLPVVLMLTQRLPCLYSTALPVIGPSITGNLPWYNIGENFSATCSAEKTFPPPNLAWFVNDIQVYDEYYISIVLDILTYNLQPFFKY